MEIFNGGRIDYRVNVFERSVVFIHQYKSTCDVKTLSQSSRRNTIPKHIKYPLQFSNRIPDCYKFQYFFLL